MPNLFKYLEQFNLHPSSQKTASIPPPDPAIRKSFGVDGYWGKNFERSKLDSFNLIHPKVTTKNVEKIIIFIFRLKNL